MIACGCRRWRRRPAPPRDGSSVSCRRSSCDSDWSAGGSGACGLNVDPYTAEGRVGRVRHLYVLEAYRRHGVGRQLVAEVIGAARGSFDRLRLRTANPEAARLYESLGFAPCAGEADCTHALDLRVTR